MKPTYPYACIDKDELLEILSRSQQKDIRICFGLAVCTIWMPKDVAKDLYKRCYKEESK